jgi:DNA-binding protein HU-beta
MKKADLVAEIAKKADLTKADSEKFLNAFIESVQEAVAKEDQVRLVGFGTFSVAHRKAGEGRNPKTGAVIQISPSKLPKFKAGKGFKDFVNK